MTEEEKLALEASKADNPEDTNEETPEAVIPAEDQKSLINEVKALRAEKREAAEAKVEAERLLQEEQDKNKDAVTLKVEEILEKKEQARAESNRTQAMAQFISERNEFHEDNDPSGLKMQALKSKFAMFNTGGKSETQEFYSMIKDAYTLLGGKQESQSDTLNNPFTSTSTSAAHVPSVSDVDKDLSPEEKKIVDSGRMTKEKLMTMKEKHPELLEELTGFIRI